MPRRVLRRVDDQAEHGRRQRGAADGADLAVGRGGRIAELNDRAVDPRLGLRDELVSAGARLALARERGELRWGELLSTGIRQEPLQAAGEMAQVEARRGGAAGAGPEIGVAGTGSGGRDVLARLDEGVRGGQQDGVDAGQRASEPDFRTGEERSWWQSNDSGRGIGCGSSRPASDHVPAPCGVRPVRAPVRAHASTGRRKAIRCRLHHELLRHLVTVADIAAAEQPGLAERYELPNGRETNETFRTLARRLLGRARRSGAAAGGGSAFCCSACVGCAGSGSRFFALFAVGGPA